MKKLKFIILGSLIALFTTGCQTWRDAAALKAGYVQKTKAEKDLENAKTDYNDKLSKKDNEIKDTKNKVDQAINDKMQYAGDRLYGANLAFQLDSNKDRTDVIINNEVKEAQAVLPVPTLNAMQGENERIVKELDETKTSLEELQKTNTEYLGEAKVLNDKVSNLQTELTNKEKEKESIKNEKDGVIDKLQNKVDIAKNIIIQKEASRANDRDAIIAAKTKGSAVLGLIAILALAGAIWSPVWKDKCAILSGILGAAAVGIWFIEPWMVGLAFGLAVALLVGWAIINHNKESKASLATYQALASIKDKNKELWDNNIAPVLSEWQTKYVKKEGEIVEVPDPSIKLHIDEKLAQVGDK